MILEYASFFAEFLSYRMWCSDVWDVLTLKMMNQTRIQCRSRSNSESSEVSEE